ncbi:hypothetical protein [Burkholderia stagnalis]|nr:hypothetical protein [Burkholderia stagnalis]
MDYSDGVLHAVEWLVTRLFDSWQHIGFEWSWPFNPLAMAESSFEESIV